MHCFLTGTSRPSSKDSNAVRDSDTVDHDAVRSPPSPPFSMRLLEIQ
ncbi:hypothetical protein SALB1_0938 [Salinisphaera sp. LB1]|nr:hypothetical protein SALB1_0938 [Salinisphaera sp. LB1]